MTPRWIWAEDYEAMSLAGAERAFSAIRRRLRERRPMLLGLATGNTMLRFYECLATVLNQSELDLSCLRTVNLDEYVGADGRWIPEGHPLSYRGYMQKHFFGRLDPRLKMDRGNIHFPDPERPAAIDEWIRDVGGLDFQLLGIGFNGHIGFNEPMGEATISAEAFAKLPSRVVGLEALTIETNARLTAGGDRSGVPRRAATLGMGTILAAREIVLLACFPQQRDPLRRVWGGRVTPELPASYLTGHADATIICADDQVRLRDEVQASQVARDSLAATGREAP
ncbi:MAG TPA: glucosamine-6-phosphate deaminase [Verrucomicrobiae bacterium]|nr:glucosamine-6-phosphate deaminase [Verrucomicrobiae bacterium]